MIKSIIFDLDGVLFDSEKVHADAWEISFRKRGIIVSDEDYLAGAGITDKLFMKYLVQKKRAPAKTNPETIMKEKLRNLIKIAERGGVPLFPGVKSAVKALSKKYILCTATNSGRKFVYTVLRNAGILKYFKIIITKNEIKKPKPSPEIYLKCLKRLGLRARECLVIEDSVPGIASAKKARIICVALTTTWKRAKLTRIADFVLSRLTAKDIAFIVKVLTV